MFVPPCRHHTDFMTSQIPNPIILHTYLRKGQCLTRNYGLHRVQSATEMVTTIKLFKKIVGMWQDV